MMATVFTRFHLYRSLNKNLSSIWKLWQSLAKPFCVSSSQHKETTIKTDDLEYPLTKTEAISYIENVLKIPNPTQKMLENPLRLLGEIQKHTKYLVPLTNLVHFKYVYEGKIFTVRDGTETMLQRGGGACFDINTFTRAVLQHLGYDTYLIGGSLPKNRSHLYDAHVGNIVQNLNYKGSFHLVEPGTRHPILEPIPLNFTRVSPVYKLISYPIRFFTDGPGILKMCMLAPEQNESTTTDDIFEEDGRMWRCLITYRTLQPLTLSYCLHVAQQLITDSTSLPDVHKELVIFGFSGGKFTVVKGQNFVQYSHDCSLTKKKLELDRVVDTVHEHFPQYSHQYLQQAHQHFTSRAANKKE